MIKRKQIIEKMDREGLITLSVFIENLRRNVIQGTLAFGALLKQIETNYPTVPNVDRNFLVKDCLKAPTKVDFALFEDLISKFARNVRPSMAGLFSSLSATIIKKIGSSPLDSFR
jgi:hypothetical protein